MSGPVMLAFGIWMLLTADFSWPNALLGLIGALLVAPLPKYRFSAGQLLYLILSVLVRLPQAILETFLIVCLPHRYEKRVPCKVAQARNPWAVFCQTLILTLTPRSLVVSAPEKGTVELHRLERKEEA
jgi:multisubunit Na+/H+ antiporter MnhE subunit